MATRSYTPSRPEGLRYRELTRRGLNCGDAPVRNEHDAFNWACNLTRAKIRTRRAVQAVVGKFPQKYLLLRRVVKGLLAWHDDAQPGA